VTAGIAVPATTIVAVTPATADGGDMLWLDETTLAVGRTYRTNAAAHDQLRSILEPAGVTVESFDMLVSGELDHLPEQAFFNVGGAEDAIRKAEELEKNA
jgi:arginine deiminase